MRCLRIIDDFLLALLALVIADVTLFHCGVYIPFLQPASYSGNVERKAWRLAGELEAFPDHPRIVMMGNSRTEAAIRETRLEELLARDGLRYRAINVAIGGSTPRSWFVLLRDGRITGRNTEIVVLGINNRTIESSKREKLRDLTISKTRLRVADTLAMTSAYSRPKERLQVFSGMIFRTPLFRDDLREFLASPAQRLREARRPKRHPSSFESSRRASAPVHQSYHRDLLSAKLGRDNRLIFDELDDFLKQSGALRRRVEQGLRYRKKARKDIARGRLKSHRVRPEAGKLKLLGQLVEDLNAEGIKVVFSVLPSSPYELDRPLKVDHLGNFFKRLEESGANVAIWHDQEIVRRLQHPANFRDMQHLNFKGANLSTRHLAGFLSSILAPPASNSQR